MSEEEIWKFLATKTKLFAAFPMKDGFPHVSPVWFCVIDGRIYLRTHDYKMKTFLARSGKVCCSADEGELYRELKGVIIWGRSRIVTEGAVIDKIEEVMGEKYKRQQWKGSEMPKEWVAERRQEKRSFIEVVPEKVSSWDNSKI
jgi:nitroimidazol reductase NimA-like FMN-containing flavoprotein (pyridoxamine 5'-phosphate oxidase superfamily)